MEADSLNLGTFTASAGPLDSLAVAGPAPTAFNYDAVETAHRRKPASGSLNSADAVLPIGKRKKLQGGTRDLHRNFVLASWMVRQHLNFVTTFDFQSDSGNSELDDQIEAIVAADAKPARNDAAQRLSLRRMLRFCEARAVIDGDVGILKVRTGQAQGIEGDRIQTPDQLTDKERDEWTNGVRINRSGGAFREFGVFRRGRSGKGYEFDRRVRAHFFHLHGYFERFDQVRGISPLAGALNTIRDGYEFVDHALVRMKVENFFGLKVTRQASDQLADIYQMSGTASEDPDSEDELAADDHGTYDVDFGQGPVMLDMDPGDDAAFLTSSNPSNESQKFFQFSIMLALKALDIPLALFDETQGKFHGNRAGWMLYERSTLDRREACQELLDNLTRWRLRLAILDGRLTLPAGTTIDDIGLRWTPRGMKWWKPLEEIKGGILAIRAGLQTPQTFCQENGTGNFEDNLRAIANAKQLASELGVELNWDIPADSSIEIPA